MGFKLISRFSRVEMSPGYMANAPPLRFTMHQRAFLTLAKKQRRLLSMYKMPPEYLANMLLPNFAMQLLPFFYMAFMLHPSFAMLPACGT